MGIEYSLGGVYRPVSMVSAVRDAHVKDMGQAVCSFSSSWSTRKGVTSGMEFINSGAISKLDM